MTRYLKKLLATILAQFGYRLQKAPKCAILDKPDSNLNVRLDFLVCHHLETIKDRSFHIVQIGAFDGTSYNDQVHQFFADPRFQGLLVEPQPKIFSRLQETYSENKQVTLENAAVANEDGEMKLYTIDTSQPNLPDWLDGCASFDMDVMLKYEDRFPNLRAHMITLTVPGLSLKSLLAKHQVSQIDLLQIDVEGFDFEVIKMVDFEKNKPAIIRFEKIHLNGADRERCYNLLIDHGYKIYIEEVDVLAYID